MSHVNPYRGQPCPLPNTGGSPADMAGLKEGDVIISLSGELITTINDIHKLLTAERIGEELSISLLRDWVRKLETYITPGQSPD